MQARHTASSLGTFTVNIIGSLVLGLVLGAVSSGGVPASVVAFVGTGICGALTTFSTFGFETVRLLEEGSILAAAPTTSAAWPRAWRRAPWAGSSSRRSSDTATPVAELVRRTGIVKARIAHRRGTRAGAHVTVGAEA